MEAEMPQMSLILANRCNYHLQNAASKKVKRGMTDFEAEEYPQYCFGGSSAP